MVKRVEPIVEEVIKRLYGKYPTTLIAKVCNCSASYVYTHARRMGLKSKHLTNPKSKHLKAILLKIVEQEVQKIRQELSKEIKN